jgi:hypothetical protein
MKISLAIFGFIISKIIWYTFTLFCYYFCIYNSLSDDLSITKYLVINTRRVIKYWKYIDHSTKGFTV